MSIPFPLVGDALECGEFAKRPRKIPLLVNGSEEWAHGYLHPADCLLGRNYHSSPIPEKTRLKRAGAAKIRDPKDLSIKILKTKELLAFRYVHCFCISFCLVHCETNAGVAARLEVTTICVNFAGPELEGTEFLRR